MGQKKRSDSLAPDRLERGVPVFFDILTLFAALIVFCFALIRRMVGDSADLIRVCAKTIEQPLISLIELPGRAIRLVGSGVDAVFIAPIRVVRAIGSLSNSFRLPRIRISLPTLPARPKRTSAPVNPPRKPQPVRTFTHFSLPQAWPNRLATFVVVAIILFLPFAFIPIVSTLSQIRTSAVLEASEGLAQMDQWKDALERKDFAGASSLASEALGHFSQAQGAVGQINAAIRAGVSLVPVAGRTVASGQALLESAALAADLAVRISSIGSQIAPNGKVVPDLLIARTGEIAAEISHAQEAATRITELLKPIRGEDLPPAYRGRFASLRAEMDSVNRLLESLKNLSDALVPALGFDTKRRYLFVFQNNTELRPSGGFIGSFAIVDIDRGAITSIEVPGGGSYDLAGGLMERLAPPLPLRSLTGAWQFQDANWFPDFAESGRKLMWFYERSGGSTVDGVIALNASFFEKILTLTGPIPMQKYNKIITAENFIEETQKSVELQYDKTINQPKSFIADLVPETLNRLSGLGEVGAAQLGSIILSAIGEREIQMYFPSQPLQARAQAFGLSGEILQSNDDFLLINDANIAANKSDGVITASVSHRVTIADDGSITDSIELTKKHAGRENSVFTGRPSRSFLRFTVPRGSSLVAAHGFTPPDSAHDRPLVDSSAEDVDLAASNVAIARLTSSEPVASYDEHGKTVFGGYMVTPVGGSTTLTLEYRLPFKITERERHSSYVLALQRQSGSRIRDYDVSVSPSQKWKTRWAYPAATSQTLHWKANPWTHDQIFAVQF